MNSVEKEFVEAVVKYVTARVRDEWVPVEVRLDDVAAAMEDIARMMAGEEGFPSIDWFEEATARILAAKGYFQEAIEDSRY